MAIQNPVDLKEKLVADFEKIGTPFLSLVIFGASATPDYLPGPTPIDIAVSFKEVTGKLLEDLHPLAVKWSKQKVVIRYVFTPDYVEHSLDTFPIEFLDMQARHIHLDGVNWLPPLVIPMRELRLQCERELRGLALHLRSDWMFLKPKAAALASLTRRIDATFHPIFRGLLHLKGANPGTRSAEVFSQVGKVFGTSDIFSRLITEKPGKSPEERRRTFDEWSQALALLIKAVDALK